MTEPNKPLLEFPCTYPLKAIGKHAEDFEMHIVSIVEQHVPRLDKTAVSTRPSNGDKYLAVTVTFTAESQAQLDNLYQSLNDSSRVLMLL